MHRTPQCKGNTAPWFVQYVENILTCIGQAQSIHCAMMQHMTAVGHRHVRPVLTNTHLLNPPIERNVGYPLRRVTKKVVFLPAEPTIGGGCLLSFRLSLRYSVHSRSK